MFTIILENGQHSDSLLLHFYNRQPPRLQLDFLNEGYRLEVRIPFAIALYYHGNIENYRVATVQVQDIVHK
ncbi:hypothetical protein ACOSP7_003879 [Xanthoceras sorbifolium]